jgi:acyl carrier protein
MLGKNDAKPAEAEASAARQDAPPAEAAALDSDAGDRSAAAAPPRLAQILASLKVHLAASADEAGKSLGGVVLQDDVDLYEAGYLDSLTASEFLLRAEKEWGVQLPDWLIGGRANTLATLAGYIDGELGSR